MSLALSLAIHQSLIAGLPSGDENILVPYSGCYVPHNEILALPECWVLSPEDYDVHALPAQLSREAPFWLNSMGEIGGIYCTDGECASWFRIQRKEQ